MTWQPDLQIRMATTKDAHAIQAIYRPYVQETATTFEEDVPSVEEISQRIDRSLSRWVWLVCESESGILGYAYSGAHRNRAAYDRSVETSIYLGQQARGQGLGKLLYSQLIEQTRALGYANAYAGITLPNRASTRLHLQLGFRFVGVFPRVGYKFDTWQDVAWWHLDLDAFPIPFD